MSLPIILPSQFSERGKIVTGPIYRDSFSNYGVLFTQNEKPTPSDFDTALLLGARLEIVPLRDREEDRFFTILGGYLLEKTGEGDQVTVATRSVFGIANDRSKGFNVTEGGSEVLADSWRLHKDYEFDVPLDDEQSVYNMNERKVGGSGWTFIVAEAKMKRGQYPASEEPGQMVIYAAENEAEYSVEGSVTNVDGSPLVGLYAVVYDRDLRSEEWLGDVAIELDGSYQIIYSPSQFRRAEKEKADLIVRVVDEAGAIYAESDTYFNAPQNAIVDLVADAPELRGLSEMRRYLEAIQPLLDVDNLSLQDLTEEDWQFIQGETRINTEHIQSLSLSTEFAGEYNDAWIVFYGLLRQGMPQDYAFLLDRDIEDLVGAYEASLDANIVDTVSVEEARDILEDLIKQAPEPELPEPETLDVTRLRLPFEEQTDEVKAQVLPKLQRYLGETLLSYMPAASERLREAVLGMDHDVLGYRDAGLQGYFREFIVPGLRLKPAVRDEVAQVRLQSLPAGQSVADLTYLDNPLHENPAIGAEVYQTRVLAYATMSGITGQGAYKFVRDAKAPEVTTEQDWSSWIEDGLINETEAFRLKHTYASALFTDEDVSLMSVMQKGAGLPVSTEYPAVKSYASLDVPDWLNLLEAESIEPPAGVDRETYASALYATSEARYPTDQLFSAVGKNTSIPLDNGLLSTFLENNPSFDVRTANTFDEQSFTEDGFIDYNYSGIPSGKQKEVSGMVRTMQRAYFLAPDTKSRTRLIEQDLTAPFKIAGMSPKEFSTTTGVSQDYATYITQNAIDIYGAGQVVWNNRFDWERPTFEFANPYVEIENALKNIPGWDAFFSEGPGCDCTHCNSLFSPAAYFVDLMLWVQRHILNINFGVSVGQPVHVLHLQNRRPDLWSIPLDCSSSLNEIPYLEVVNKVLATFLLANEVDGSGQELNSEQALWAAIRDRALSMHLPFDLYGRVVDLYLSHFSLTRFELHQTMGHPPDTPEAIQLYFNMPPAEYDLVSGASNDFDELYEMWGMEAGASSVSLEHFMKRSRLNRQEVELISGLLALADGTGIDRIEIDLDEDGSPIVKGLTLQSLDYLQRSIRLQKATGWSLAELDIVLFALSTRYPDSDWEFLLQSIYRLHRVQAQLGLSIKQLPSAVGIMPDITMVGEETRLIDQFFEGVSVNEPYNGLNPVTGAISKDPNTSILIAGLGVTETELYGLISALTDSLDRSGDLIVLTPRTLATLHWVILLSKRTSFKLEDVDLLLPLLLLGGAESSIYFDNPILTLGFISLLDETSLEWPVLYGLLTDGVFPESVNLPHRNPGTLVAALKEIAVQSLTEDEKEKLYSLEFSQFLGVEEAAFKQILSLSDIQQGNLISLALNQDDLDIFREEFMRLAHWWVIINQMKPPLSLLSIEDDDQNSEDDDRFKTLRGLGFKLAENDPSRVFVTLDALRQLAHFNHYSRRVGDTDEMLIAFIREAGEGLLPEKDEHIQLFETILNVSVNQLEALVQHVPTIPLLPLDRIKQLEDILVLSEDLGLQGPALGDIVSTEIDRLQAARSAVQQAVAARYDDEEKRQEVLSGYRERELVFQRDALVEFLLSVREDFKDTKDIYYYFLLDPEMEDCARTTKVLSGISSLQLYVQRVFMNVEQTEEGYPVPLTVQFDPDNFHVVEKTWSWRKNYRVWEANRKLFLFPENYVEPDLRDNKTPFFKELEEELLQQEVTEETLENAYRAYLDKYMRVSQLQVGGAYFHRSPGTDSGKVYICSRTTEDPLEYYWRSAELNEKQWVNWTPWQRIDLPINSSYVSPVFFRNRLYVFWIEINTRGNTSFEAGFSILKSYTHILTLKYSYLNQSGEWVAPVSLKLREVFDELCFVAQDKSLFTILDKKDKKISDLKGELDDSENPGEQLKNLLKDIVINNVSYSDLDDRDDDNDENNDKRIIKRWVRYLKEYGTNQGFYESLRKYRKKKINAKGLFRELTGLAELREDLVPGAILTWSPNYDQQRRNHVDIIEDYVLEGYPWERVYVNVVSEADESDRLVLYLNGYEARVGNGSASVEGAFYELDLFRSSIAKVSHSEDGELDAYVLKSSSSNLQTQLFKLKKENAFFEATFHVEIHDYNEPIKESDKGSSNPGIDFTAHSFPGHRAFRRGDFSSGVSFSFSNLGAFDLPIGVIGAFNLGSRQIPERKPAVQLINQGNLSGGVSLFTINVGERSYVAINSSDTVYLHRLGSTLAEPFAELLFDQGIQGLLDLSTQHNRAEYWHTLEGENTQVKLYTANGYVQERESQLNFSVDSANGLYLRELFFHIPYLFAHQLNANQSYEEAQRWLHIIFNPTVADSGEDSLERVWRYLPFKNVTIKTLNEILASKTVLRAFELDSFSPYAAARTRVGAFHKAVVMKYIDNLLDWGDALFARDTYESINEATLLYVMACDLLGDRPQIGKACDLSGKPGSFADLQPELPNADELRKNLDDLVIQGRIPPHLRGELDDPGLINVSRFLPAYNRSTDPARNSVDSSQRIKNQPNQLFNGDDKALTFSGHVGTTPAVEIGSNLEQSWSGFCIPKNEHLMAYWDRVEDRLFKIRNCQNIQGIRRSLALFDPVLDPLLLARAKAAGLTLEDVADDGNVSLYHYRFMYLLDRARTYVGTVQAFGNALLSALEKKDGEELSQIRLVHEQNILSVTKRLKEQQVEESKMQVSVLSEQKVSAEINFEYYERLVDEGLSIWELTQQSFQRFESIFRIQESVFHSISSVFHLIPETGSPFSMKYGGKQVGDSYATLARAIGARANRASSVSNAAGLVASNLRREEEWVFRRDTAEQDLKQLERQIAAAEIRAAIAERDLEVHEKNIEQLEEQYEFVSDKYTNLGLYTWMASHMGRLYRQTYLLAYEMAKKAERAYHYERDREDIVIQGTAWDQSRAGLLAGEALQLQLNELEKAYMDANQREQEVTLSFSMAQWAPDKLLKLKETGSCRDVEISEDWYDMYYPDQYRRRIKSVRLTIPCVTGPYTNVACTLSLQNPLAPVKSMATSTANNDSGVFELNFRDERYLPFEGADADSTWNLELPQAYRAFDYNSISDVVFHISYMAKSDKAVGEQKLMAIKEKGLSLLKDPGLLRFFSLRQEFSAQFHRLFQSDPDGNGQSVVVKKTHFPFFVQPIDIEFSSVSLYVLMKDRVEGSLDLALTVNDQKVTGWNAFPDSDSNKLFVSNNSIPLPVLLKENEWEWQIKIEGGSEELGQLEDIILGLSYKL